MHKFLVHRQGDDRGADSFSFGTNDLVRMVCGISRDGVEEKFLANCLNSGLLEDNLFESLNRRGVGELVSMACERGQEASPRLKLGARGKHGGDLRSVELFHRPGLGYVSCSRPLARS